MNLDEELRKPGQVEVSLRNHKVQESIGLADASRAFKILEVGMGASFRSILGGVVEKLKKEGGFPKLAVCTHNSETAYKSSGLSNVVIDYTLKHCHEVGGLAFEAPGILVRGGESIAEILFPNGLIYTLRVLECVKATDGTYAMKSDSLPSVDSNDGEISAGKYVDMAPRALIKINNLVMHGKRGLYQSLEFWEQHGWHGVAKRQK